MTLLVVVVVNVVTVVFVVVVALSVAVAYRHNQAATLNAINISAQHKHNHVVGGTGKWAAHPPSSAYFFHYTFILYTYHIYCRCWAQLYSASDYGWPWTSIR